MLFLLKTLCNRQITENSNFVHRDGRLKREREREMQMRCLLTDWTRLCYLRNLQSTNRPNRKRRTWFAFCAMLVQKHPV